jgi:hypothetical protein
MSGGICVSVDTSLKTISTQLQTTATNISWSVHELSVEAASNM